MRTDITQRCLVGLIAGAVVGLLAGCGAGSTSTVSGQAQVTYVNALMGVSVPATAASPDLVNLTSTTTPTAGQILPVTSLDFGSASPYTLLTDTSVSVAVSQSVTNKSISLRPATASITPQYSETLVLTGVAGQKTGAYAPQLLTFIDQFPSFGLGVAPAGSSTTAAIRVINLSPQSGSLDVYNGPVPIPGLAGVSYPNATAYVPIPAGSANLLTLGIYTTPTPGSPAQSIATATSYPGLTLAPGNAYTVLLVGATTNLSVQGVTLEPFDVKLIADN